MSRSTPINIILVHQRLKLHWKDLADISRRIIAKSRQVRMLLVSEVDNADVLPADVWRLPTITVSFGPLGKFNPKRGPVFANKAIAKELQASRLAAANVATPRTAVFKFGMRLDPDQWGNLVILKPAPLRLTSSAEGIHLYRTECLSKLRSEHLPENHMARRAPMLVQQFIDTGEYPSKQRITTLFGEPFHWAFSISKQPRPVLTSPDEVLERAAVSTSGSGERDWSFDDPGDDILDIARRAAAVFRSIPLLGLDIVRCKGTGRPYVLEINAGGNVWHYSSPLAAKERAAHPENFPNEQQKNRAFDLVATILIEKALRFAR
jgi:hypothetical protein